MMKQTVWMQAVLVTGVNVLSWPQAEVKTFVSVKFKSKVEEPKDTHVAIAQSRSRFGRLEGMLLRKERIQ
jgi:hypothetical protein